LVASELVSPSSGLKTKLEVPLDFFAAPIIWSLNLIEILASTLWSFHYSLIQKQIAEICLYPLDFG
jgi:hypothetical protein